MTGPAALADLTCDVCNAEPAVGVAAMPGVAASFAYGHECLVANAHPYSMIVANTAMIGGLDDAADWWKQMVTDTLRHLKISRPQFNADVVREIRAFEEYEKQERSARE